MSISLELVASTPISLELVASSATKLDFRPHLAFL